MLCPSCFNDNLSPSGDGKLVCDDCGEEFAGFREEEMDDLLAGTAVSNRASQASQAKSVRDRMQSKERSQTPVKVPKNLVSDERAICECVFLLSKAIVDKLIQLKYVHVRIKEPLFEILTHWVRRRHAGVMQSCRRQIRLKSHVVLSMICLAAIYIRSPMLPRDLCRLVATRQVPFLTALRHVLPKVLTRSRAVREVFSVGALPIASQISENINVLGQDQLAWPPLKRFFISNNVGRQNPYKDREWYPRSYPIGHLHITILRMSRLLGLPDDFGARVLRYIELRRIAVKMARVLNRERDGPWDQSQVDAYEIQHIPNYNDAQLPFSTTIRGSIDNYGFPSDESLQIDFINTMRLCYGSRQPRGVTPDPDGEVLTAREKQMALEWKKCKGTMMDWLRHGSAEDMDSVLWTSMSPSVHASISGNELFAYSRFVDDSLFGEKVPAFMGKFARIFEEIARERAVEGDGTQTADKHGCVSAQSCIYDQSRCPEEAWYEPKEGEIEMQWQCGIAGGGAEDVHRIPLLALPYRGYRGRRYLRRKEARPGKYEQEDVGERTKDEDVNVGDEGRQEVNEITRVSEGHGDAELGSKMNDLRLGAAGRSTEESVGEDLGHRDAKATRSESPKKCDTSSAGSGSGQAGTGRDVMGMSAFKKRKLSAGTTCQRSTCLAEGANSGKRRSSVVDISGGEEDQDILGLAKGEVPWWIAYLLESRSVSGKAAKQFGRRGQPCSLDYLELLEEPSGIGLAWTILRRFFAGSSVDVSGSDEKFHENKRWMREMISSSNKSLSVVITYLIGLSGDIR